MAIKKKFTPWSSLGNMLGKPPSWWPEEERERIQAYEKYDQLYWNDPTQYAIRVLENEEPIYIPNARTVVDTTAQYLMKGLQVIVNHDVESTAHETQQQFVDNFLTRERFYSKFHINKQAGICRGDSAFHITADPNKPEGERISIDTLHPGCVWKVTDPDDPDEVIRIHIVQIYTYPKDEDPQQKEYVRKLTYHKIPPTSPGGTQKIAREEAIWELEPTWYGSEPKPVKKEEILPYEELPEQIQHFPVYWFNNIEWEDQLYGSSDLRGLEFLDWAVSQGSTDTQAALALEGLGVFATDGGRPVNDSGDEEDWEVAPGKVMEVPSGAYFRRVDGVGSITPMMDQLNYLEGKMYQASGMTDVALGKIDVQVAQSGVALAIKFMPTLARIEHRDIAYKEILSQMFHDLQLWYEAYESTAFPMVHVHIAESKLPVDRAAKVNELNNMLDRKIISRQFYRKEMHGLGYKIPDNIEDQIQEEAELDAERALLSTPPELQQNAEDASAGRNNFPPESNPDNGRVDRRSNRSNNRTRPNESSGTERNQTLRRQQSR